MKLVFTGIQGCGKGTQGRLLAEKYGFEIVEMGGELRKVIASGSELGLKLKQVMNKGFMVSDELGAEVMRAAIESYKDKDRVIFDGFIRLQWNKDIFDSLLSDYKVVLFQLSEEKAKDRLLGRVYNPATGETFTAGTLTDPATGDTLERRKDDTEASILQRIDEYITKAVPIVRLQRQEGKVLEINADQPISKVFADLEARLELSAEKDYCNSPNI